MTQLFIFILLFMLTIGGGTFLWQELKQRESEMTPPPAPPAVVRVVPRAEPAPPPPPPPPSRESAAPLPETEQPALTLLDKTRLPVALPPLYRGEAGVAWQLDSAAAYAGSEPDVTLAALQVAAALLWRDAVTGLGEFFPLPPPGWQVTGAAVEAGGPPWRLTVGYGPRGRPAAITLTLGWNPLPDATGPAEADWPETLPEDRYGKGARWRKGEKSAAIILPVGLQAWLRAELDGSSDIRALLAYAEATRRDGIAAALPAGPAAPPDFSRRAFPALVQAAAEKAKQAASPGQALYDLAPAIAQAARLLTLIDEPEMAQILDSSKLPRHLTGFRLDGGQLTKGEDGWALSLDGAAPVPLAEIPGAPEDAILLEDPATGSRYRLPQKGGRALQQPAPGDAWEDWYRLTPVTVAEW